MKSPSAFLVISAFLLSSCATEQHTVVSTNTSQLVVGEQPQGYPITTNVRIGDTCTRVTESWVPFKDPASGKQLWLKQIDRVQTPCQ
jgi:hypothetical protein